MASEKNLSPALGRLAILGLALGIALGSVGQLADLEVVRTLSGWVAPLGSLWLRALQMTIVPLIVTQLLAAIVRPGERRPMGKLAGRTAGVSLAYLLGAGALVLLVAPPILGLFSPPPDVAAVFQMETVPQEALDAAEGTIGSGESWLVGIVPRNPFEAAAQGEIIQLILFVVLFGLAASRLPDNQRIPLAHLFRSVADAVLHLVGWVLMGMPIGVFCLALDLSLNLGLGVLGLFAMYTVGICGAFLLFIGALYPITSLAGQVSPRVFAKALLPSQIVAAGTQSSLASLPAVIEGGREELDLPDECSGFVLPFCISTFRFNSTISEGFNLLFLAYVFGVPLTLGDMAIFQLGIVLISFSVTGLPRGGVAFIVVPLYVAVGIPIEGAVFVEVAKTIPDVFFTVYNVTASLSVATIVSVKERLAEKGGASRSKRPAVGIPALFARVSSRSQRF